jgi:predicted nucleic acid-binding protein
MCIIVDANAARDLSAPTDDGRPVLEWLLKGRGGLIIGGLLKRELGRSGMRDTLVVLGRAGRLHNIDDAQVQSVATKIERKCCSNDCHVVAAAIVSGCRLIFSRDQNLHKDAKNRDILNPAASIYQSKSHKHLLTDCHCN